MDEDYRMGSVQVRVIQLSEADKWMERKGVVMEWECELCTYQIDEVEVNCK
jgi:hypothetical protein